METPSIGASGAGSAGGSRLRVLARAASEATTPGGGSTGGLDDDDDANEVLVVPQAAGRKPPFHANTPGKQLMIIEGRK